MSKSLFRLPAVLAAVVLLAGINACDDDDEVFNIDDLEPGSITLTVGFVGTVSEEMPVIVEIKETKLGDPIATAVVTENLTSVTIDSLPPGTYFVALFWDENNDATLDPFTEPIVFYSIDPVDQSVSVFGDATEVTLPEGQNIDLGTISFDDLG